MFDLFDVDGILRYHGDSSFILDKSQWIIIITIRIEFIQIIIIQIMIEIMIWLNIISTM